jgi:peptidylprolyl isomerase
MIFKHSSLVFLATVCTAAAQTTQPTAPKTTTTSSSTHHNTTTTTTKPHSNIPRVAGIPKTLYALKYVDITPGTGPLAVTHKWYTVHYTGWFPDGTKFDSSHDHPGGAPITFPYGAHQVIYGWDTGFEGMHVGGKRRLFIPYELAYGELGNPPRMPAKANLIFDVELIGQSDTPPERPKPATPPTPATPAKPATEPEAKPATEVPPTSTTRPEAKPATPDTQPKATPNP